jgi:hypothetical protein
MNRNQELKKGRSGRLLTLSLEGIVNIEKNIKQLSQEKYFYQDIMSELQLRGIKEESNEGILIDEISVESNEVVRNCFNRVGGTKSALKERRVVDMEVKNSLAKMQTSMEKFLISLLMQCISTHRQRRRALIMQVKNIPMEGI